jgi:hypothetical protein
MDDNLAYFTDQVRASILSVDPTALVTVSFFAPQEPNPWRPGDFRLIRTKPIFERSSMDFLTIHPYPGTGLTLPQFMENFGLTGTEQKPIVFGEFGAYADPFVYISPADAAPALQQWVANSCAFGVDGWSLWTWDTEAQPDGVTLWNALADGGTLEHALAPNDRPDPCAAKAPRDLAFDRPATASASLSDGAPAFAFDLGHGSAWRAGGAPPQWIEVDLGSSSTIAKVRLTEWQVGTVSLAGRVLGGPGPSPSTELVGFNDSDPIDGKVLEFTGSWADVRYLRVERTFGLDIGWREMEAYGP